MSLVFKSSHVYSFMLGEPQYARAFLSWKERRRALAGGLKIQYKDPVVSL